MKQELLTDALGTLDADIIGDYLATEKKAEKKARQALCISACRMPCVYDSCYPGGIHGIKTPTAAARYHIGGD